MTQTITESNVLDATPVKDHPGRLLVTLITPGQGSSGSYSREVLETAAADNVFPAGTQMYMNHPSASEATDRPERSVFDLGAVLAEDAYTREADGALVAEADVFSQHRPMLTEMHKHIGVSVRAAADVSESPAGRVVERLVPAQSNTVDFVTRAGRGGSFTVIESARPSLVNERALRHRGVTEATVNDQREALSDVLKAAHGAEKTWVWLRDFDDTTAWFEISTDDSEKTYSQAYATGDNGLPESMTGDPSEVRQVTKYVPVNTPAADSTTEASKEDTMGTIQVEESEHTRLTETAGRVTALESERDTAISDRDKAISERDQVVAREAATTFARARVTESNSDLSAATVDRIVTESVRDITLKDGNLDETAFATRVDAVQTAEESYLASLTKTGSITGLGSTGSKGDEVTESDIDKAVADAFGRQTKEA